MTEDNRQVYDYVEIMAQQGRDPDEIADHVACIFTCEWPLRRRLRLAWRVVKPLHWRLNPFRWLGNGLKDLWSATKAVPAKHWVLFVILLSVYVFSMYAMAWWLR